MATFVALLRGVNVGKAKRVPMAELRTLLTGLGYSGVATLLNSGNAVFRASAGTPARHAADIAAVIAARLKIDVPVIVKSASEFASIVAENSVVFGASDHSRLLVAFVQDRMALTRMAAIKALAVPPEQFVIGPNAAYLLCASGILGSKAGAALLGKTAMFATTRNWATVLKLHTLASECDA